MFLANDLTKHTCTSNILDAMRMDPSNMLRLICARMLKFHGVYHFALNPHVSDDKQLWEKSRSRLLCLVGTSTGKRKRHNVRFWKLHSKFHDDDEVVFWGQ